MIGLLGLVVLGPERLPAAVRQVGALLGKLRQLSVGFPTDLGSFLASAEADTADPPTVPGSSQADRPDG